MTNNEVIGATLAALRYERSVLMKAGQTRAAMAITDYIENAPDESFRRLFDLLTSTRARQMNAELPAAQAEVLKGMI